jgi:hypothetical protein
MKNPPVTGGITLRFYKDDEKELFAKGLAPRKDPP